VGKSCLPNLSFKFEVKFYGLVYPQIRATGVSLRSHDLEASKLQLAKFNAHRRFRSLARLIIAKSKFEKIMLMARSARNTTALQPSLSANAVGSAPVSPVAAGGTPSPIPLQAQDQIPSPVRGDTQSAEEAEDLPFGDKYDMQSELGRGGVGTVYKALSKATMRTAGGEMVAVKVIDRKKLSPRAEGQVRNEAKILMSLYHPNIIRCFDIYEEPSTFFIVMEIMEGGELFDRIVKKVFYSEKEARDVVRLLLLAIKHCHDHDVVHRDLKPENLMLAGDSDDEQIKLIDFGLSGIASGLTLEGYVGTPGYTAPELFEHKPHGKPVDMWAIGVISYVLLAGYLPYKATPRAKYQQMARRGKLEFHPEYWTDVSAEAKDLITNLMRVKVEKRYTVEQALAHPWLKASPVLLRKNTLNKSIKELKHFNAARKFRVICKLIIAHSKFLVRMNEAKSSAAVIHELAEQRQTFPDKYELREEIGRGGFGIVYRALQKNQAAASRFGNYVAVKQIERTKLGTKDEQAIRTECTILESLSHPHIIKCLDVFEETSTFFIVMELVEGGELFTRLVERTTYTEKEARDLVDILLSTIKHCHDHNVVHRSVFFALLHRNLFLPLSPLVLAEI
jgi:calcium/calmodulin-dependent protein kinase I